MTDSLTAEQFERTCDIVERYLMQSWDGTTAMIYRAVVVQDLFLNAITEYYAWLDPMRHRAEVLGNDWTTAECRRQARLDGDLTTPPEWIAQAAEQGGAA